ncbi:uncharacterized PE-PGRS family protein PE_PGRS54-like [Daphnia carinata]|uniref:uncharacterized PE-PGRS family protein PE_PGRS54-like n=1 Tax=Daphnia carinata TaxID=120202 RepID=UPI00257EF471|nr:uncharacterized PE-PGRS family protein PE_PGRS54-like [Daphnia carinata]
MAAATSLQMHLQHSPRKKNFGYEETIRLLELWTHYTNGGTHPELGKGHRTGRLWLVISERMKAMNYNRGPEECKVRVGNLRAKYTKLKRGYLAGEGVPDWPYYPVLAKFLEGRTEFGDSYDAGSHSYTEPEARPGASHHHPGMFLSMSMEEPNEPLACNVDGGGGRRGAGGGAGGGSSRSNDDDSSVSMPESGSSAGSEHNDAPPNGHMAGAMGPADLPGLGGHHPPLLGPSGLKRRPVSPADDPRRPTKRPKHGTSNMLLSLMQAMLKIEEEHLKLQQERAASEAAMMQAVTAFFSNMTQMFGGHMPSFSSKPEVQNNNSAGSQGGAGGSGTTAGSSGLHSGGAGGNNNQASGSKTPSNPSSSCSNSPAYSHTYSNPPMVGNSGMNKMHGMDGPGAATNMGTGSAGHHYPYGGMNQPSPSPSSAGQMASPASYPLSPAYQQGVVNTMMGAGNSGTGGGGGGWYNNGSSGKGAASSNAPMAVHPFSSDILGIPKSRHDTM